MNMKLNRQLHMLLQRKGLMGQKEALVLSYSKGRTSSSKELTDMEAGELVRWLMGAHPASTIAHQDNGLKMRRKMIAMAYEMRGKGKPAIAWLDGWCRQYGYLHKGLNSYKAHELPKLLGQFEAVYKHFLSKV